jgi:hypothetical protein
MDLAECRHVAVREEVNNLDASKSHVRMAILYSTSPRAQHASRYHTTRSRQTGHTRVHTSDQNHGLAGSADSLAKNVIASQGKMADAMGFSVERAERPRQAHSSL